MSDGNGQVKTRGSMYDQVCHILEIQKNDDETADEFKIRAVHEFNQFSQEEWDELSDGLQMWISNVSETMARNIGKTKRVRSLPGLPGLDGTVRRVDPTQPPRQATGRKRVKGEDATTRVMTVMAGLDNPEQAKIDDVRKLVEERYHVKYSDSAIKFSLAAFNTARTVLGLDKGQAQHAA